MSARRYGMLCPITKACELLEPRWTIPILTEIWSGSSRFNDIRRGVGNISSALLSKRLKELQEKGLVERIEDSATGEIDYVRTEMAIELEPSLNALAVWAQKYIVAEVAAGDNDVSSMMWDLRRKIEPNELPARRVVIRFHFTDTTEFHDTYWLVVTPGSDAELCTAVPGYDVDLFVETTVASLAGIILGRTNIAREMDQGNLFLSGNARLLKTMDRWLSLCSYAEIDGIAMAQ